jgi:predicted metal-dependent hydrolase
MKQILPAVSGITNASSKKVIIISGYPVSITRKKIKHIHLKVCPPDGALKLSAPLQVSLKTIERFLIQKTSWIEKAIVKVQTQRLISTPEYNHGEIHYFGEQPYTLKITECAGVNGIRLHTDFVMEVLVKKTASSEQVEKILFSWYRKELKELIPGLLNKWEPLMDVHALEWGVKRMKTRWGSCNTAKKRIWLNLELIKKPIICLEYILVHELTHLLEPSHNTRFYTLLGSFMPDWKKADTILKEFGRNIDNRDVD